MSGRVGIMFATVTAFLLTAASVFAQAGSHVRIVRLSYIDGQVQMEHGDQGLNRAVLNTPIVEGTRIVTRNDGLAEVEFEDQSALRVAENSEVKVRRLSMTETGAKVNEVEVVRGVVFFDVHSKGDDVYRAAANGATFLVRRDTQTRISAAPDRLQLAVFKGTVQLENQPQLVSVKKSETLTLDPNQASEYKVTHGTEPLPVDAWNKEREAYGAAYAHNAGYGGPKTGYGLQDLNYYGEYFYASGYGYVWQPYGFADSMIGWSPYSNGAWAFCPGLGYAWASAYPWGWLPYHYGSWAFLGGGVGWAWVPGSYAGQWYANNFVGTPVVARPPVGWQPATAPSSSLAGTSPKPTILVGKAAGSPPYVPGGRIPPSFSSVIAGRNVGPNAARGNLAFPNARYNSVANQNVFVPHTSRSTQSGHVFAAPNSVSATSLSPGFSSMGAARGYGGGARSAGMGASSTSSGGHSSGGGGGGHASGH